MMGQVSLMVITNVNVEGRIIKKGVGRQHTLTHLHTHALTLICLHTIIHSHSYIHTHIHTRISRFLNKNNSKAIY